MTTEQPPRKVYVAAPEGQPMTYEDALRMGEALWDALQQQREGSRMTTPNDMFEEPVTVEGVPQVHKGKRSRRFQLNDEVRVTVHEDGRIHVHSKTQRLAVTWLAAGSTGSEIDLVPAPDAEDSPS